MPEPMPDGRHDNPEVRHEPSDVSVRGVLITAGVLVGVALGIHLAAWGLYVALTATDLPAKESAFPLAARGEVPAAPVLEGVKREAEGHEVWVHADELRGADVRRLDGYGWVDRKAGVVRIPLRTALEVLAEPGRLPARGAPAGGEK